jgi:tRNA (cytidine/uridine-2'-O-)-methyltransferase
MRLALFEPDLAANTGAAIRLAACLGVMIDIIEPCGFPMSSRSLARAGLDYLHRAELEIHPSWDKFRRAREERLVLLTTLGDLRYCDAKFGTEDILLVGREGAGVPEHVHSSAGLRVRIPMVAGMRSLNVVTAAAMVLGEALRQTKGFPE